MKILNRLFVLGVAVMVCCSSLCAGQASSGSAWTIGEPIVTYWAGPGTFTPVNDETAAQLRAGGWNLAWAKQPEDLDVYDHNGLRAMYMINMPDVDDPAQRSALEETVDRVRNHPAMYAYYIVDEPGTGAFSKLGKLCAWLHQHDPAHLAYINLLPTYATDKQLQVSDDSAERARVGSPQDFAGIHTDDKTALRYRQYLRQFIETVHPQLISYDHYHFLRSGDGPQYFLNLSLVRAAALAAHVPFLNIIQACNSPAEGWREPNEAERSWLTYTSLAYGAQGIAHFRYDTGLWQDAKNTTIPLAHYWATSRTNRSFTAIATELQPLTSLGAYHCGTVPLGGAPLPPDSIFAPETTKEDILLGLFGKQQQAATHAIVVNLNTKSSTTVTLRTPGPTEAFHAPTRQWRAMAGDNKITLSLAPGTGKLLRLSQE